MKTEVPQWVKDQLPGREIVSCSVDGNTAIVQVKIKYGPGQTGPAGTKTLSITKGQKEANWYQG